MAPAVYCSIGPRLGFWSASSGPVDKSQSLQSLKSQSGQDGQHDLQASSDVELPSGEAVHLHAHLAVRRSRVYTVIAGSICQLGSADNHGRARWLPL